MYVSAKCFSSSCGQQVWTTSVFFGLGFRPFPFSFPFPFSNGEDSVCDACVGDSGGEFGAESSKAFVGIICVGCEELPRFIWLKYFCCCAKKIYFVIVSLVHL